MSMFIYIYITSEHTNKNVSEKPISTSAISDDYGIIIMMRPINMTIATNGALLRLCSISTVPKPESNFGNHICVL